LKLDLGHQYNVSWFHQCLRITLSRLHVRLSVVANVAKWRDLRQASGFLVRVGICATRALANGDYRWCSLSVDNVLRASQDDDLLYLPRCLVINPSQKTQAECFWSFKGLLMSR
jgi:hypothetical protein